VLRSARSSILFAHFDGKGTDFFLII